MHQHYEDFVERGAAIVVVGPDDADAFEEYWTGQRLPFIGLPDPHHEVLDRFGQEVKLLRLGRMPALVLVDKQGVVRYAHYGHSMSDIPKNDELLAVLDELG